MISQIKNPPIAQTFYAMRNYVPHKDRVRFSRKTLSQKDIYLAKKLARLTRKQTSHKDENVKQFIAWVKFIQFKLNLSHEGFVKRINACGGQVTTLTVRLWRNSHGHFPSEKNFRALLVLEREVNITKEDLKVIFGITTTNCLEKKKCV